MNYDYANNPYASTAASWWDQIPSASSAAEYVASLNLGTRILEAGQAMGEAANRAAVTAYATGSHYYEYYQVGEKIETAQQHVQSMALVRANDEKRLAMSNILPADATTVPMELMGKVKGIDDYYASVRSKIEASPAYASAYLAGNAAWDGGSAMYNGAVWVSEKVNQYRQSGL